MNATFRLIAAFCAGAFAMSPAIAQESPPITSAPSATTEPAVEKPGPTNTGPTDRSLLKPMKGTTITQPGTVLENVHIQGTLTIKADNVTVRNFVIDANNAPYAIRAFDGHTGGLFEHGELINANSALIYGTGFTARHLNLHESGADGLKVQGRGGPTVVERCWIHHIGKNEGAHADGNQSIGVDNVIFRHNYFDLPITDPAPYKQNACFILQDKSGPVSNFVIDQNWLNGGGWVLYIPPGAESIHVTNNKFSRHFRFGIMVGNPATFTGNTWEDTGEPVSPRATRKIMNRQ